MIQNNKNLGDLFTDQSYDNMMANVLPHLCEINMTGCKDMEVGPSNINGKGIKVILKGCPKLKQVPDLTRAPGAFVEMI